MVNKGWIHIEIGNFYVFFKFDQTKWQMSDFSKILKQGSKTNPWNQKSLDLD